MDHFSSLERKAMAGAARLPGQTPAQAVADRVSEAQHRLAVHGHDPGTRSGQLDPSTREAIGRFQRAVGLPVTKTIDSDTHAALAAPPGSVPSQAAPPGAPPVPRVFSPSGRTPPRSRTTMGGKMWKGTPKIVPVIFAQGALAAASSNTIAITPSWAFRGEHLVIDPTTGALCTVQIPSVGPNPQVAGGTPSTNIPGTMFPPTQTGCLNLGMDISEQGNQLSLTFANSQTSLPLNFVALIMGTVVEQMSDQETAAVQAQAVRTGLSAAGNYVPHVGLSPAMSYRG